MPRGRGVGSEAIIFVRHAKCAECSVGEQRCPCPGAWATGEGAEPPGIFCKNRPPKGI